MVHYLCCQHSTPFSPTSLISLRFCHAITPSTSCIDKKLLVRNGVFVIEPDILPSVIDANICETTDCESVDYLVGLREIDLSDCVEGEYFELVKIPKALWPVCQATE